MDRGDPNSVSTFRLAHRNAASADRGRNFLLPSYKPGNQGLDISLDCPPTSDNDVPSDLRHADKERQVQDLCNEHKASLKGLAELVKDQGQWDLSLPVAVIDARERPHQFHLVAVGSIGNVLKISTYGSHRLMVQLYELYQDRGAEGALEWMLNESPDAEEFSEVFAIHQQERNEGGKPMWSSDDAAKFCKKSRDAFADKEIAVAALLPGEPYELMTFGIPTSFYLH